MNHPIGWSVVDGSRGSDRQLRFVPGGAGGGVVSESPVALVGGLRGDVEGVGDLAPGRTPVDGASDRDLGPPVEIAGLTGQITSGGQRLSLLMVVHGRQLWLMTR